MLKKFLSALIALVLIITSVTGISLVTAYATGDIATPDILSTTENVTGTPIEPTTQLDTSFGPVVRDVTRAELERYVNPPSWGHQITAGTIFDTKEFDEALAYAKEVLANPNATQEEINTAYYNLVAAEQGIKTVGWTAAPFLSGDYDCDDEVTIKDATKIQMLVAKLITNLSDKGIACCFSDVNFDFNINIKDATMVQSFVAGFTDEATCGYAGQRRSPQYYYNNQYTIG